MTLERFHIHKSIQVQTKTEAKKSEVKRLLVMFNEFRYRNIFFLKLYTSWCRFCFHLNLKLLAKKRSCKSDKENSRRYDECFSFKANEFQSHWFKYLFKKSEASICCQTCSNLLIGIIIVVLIGDIVLAGTLTVMITDNPGGLYVNCNFYLRCSCIRWKIILFLSLNLINVIFNIYSITKNLQLFDSFVSFPSPLSGKCVYKNQKNSEIDCSKLTRTLKPYNVYCHNS